jgi:outer membrane protein insertion porin family
VQCDRRDDIVLPERGSLLTLSARVFSQPLLSDADFVKLGGSFSLITPLKQELALVSSLRVGAAVPWGGTQRVPLSERFFAGGDSTLRGFGRDEVGPAEQGLPSGGQALVLWNEELRIPLWRRLKGVAFYDAGNVYPEVGDVDLSDVRHVLGLGLRLETPIGPLRIEYGRKLDREPGESRGELFLAIGNAF